MNTREKTYWLALIIIIALLMGALGLKAQQVDAQEPTTYYVTPGGTGDCTSWETACELHFALMNAVTSSEIWIAAGIYKPTAEPSATDPRSATFQLKDGVAVYGGFTGTETSRDERDPQANLTVLSGDLNGDDGENFADNGENSYHVLTGASGAILDGVTITAGNANGTLPHNMGGGMFNKTSSSPTMTDVTFSGNTATMGGGMYNGQRSSPSLSNATFSGNAASDGGGMYNFYSSSPTLTNVTFSGNTAIMGGGILNYNCSSPTLTDVTFSGNNAHSGGGMYNDMSSNPTLTDVTFSGNTATMGGGIYNYYSSSPTLTDATFSGNTAAEWGGGLFNYKSSNPSLNNVKFSDNRAIRGGGMVNLYSSSPTLSNVTFSGNTAAEWGGGMFNKDSSSPTLTDVTFSSNTAANWGGGMYNVTISSPTLTNVTFSGNTANSGGGMYNGSSSPTLTNVTFSGNSAFGGGGMFNGNSSPTLTDVTFSENSASSGGGLLNTYSSPTLTNVTFSNNSATNSGGGINNLISSPSLSNVTFSGNTAENGGGIYIYYSSFTLTNVTFSGNSADRGGGLFNFERSQLLIQNAILWGETGGEVVNYDTSSVTITSSVVQGGCPTGATCTNVIDTDPRLGTLGNYGGSNDTIPLLPGSSAIDAGDGSLCPTADQRGVTRVGVCDIGAFEYDYTGIYYVAPGGSGTRDGQSWMNASDLQNALKTARSGDELWVAAGVYKPTTDLTDRIATFQLKEGVAVYGGFAGTESSRDERDPQANLTVLSGDLNGDDGENFANNGENSYHVVTGVTGAILDGVTITAGNADYPASSQDLLLRYAGAGMYNQNSNPILSNITFSGNIARAGGGMYNYSSSPTLSNITFSGNSAMNNGGGMFNYDSSNPTLDNITFSGNSAVYDGGGMYNFRSSSPTLTNVTFSGNSANGGGGMYNSSSYPVIRNSILWGDSGGEVVNQNTTSATITSSVVQGGCPTGATCTNVIDTDPRLGTLGSYGGSTLTIPLLPGSSAIDAGDDTLCPTSDQRGVARVGVCDIGAFESQGFSFSDLTDTPQTTLATTAFNAPLGLIVSANATGEPVDGGLVTFDVPIEGPSAILIGNPAFITGGFVSVTAAANDVAGSYEVTASASGAAPASFLLTNEVAADLSVTMSTDAKPTDSKITYTIEVTNAGPHPAENVVLTNPLPTGTALVKVTATQGTCSAGKDKVITCDLGALQPDQSISITLTIKQVKSTPPIINVAIVSSATADPYLENNTASVTLQ